MSDTKYSMESSYKIWDDVSGESMVVCSDGDGLDLIEIRSICSSGVVESRMTFNLDQAKLLLDALARKIEDMQ